MSQQSLSRCGSCGYHIRGENHDQGYHHNHPNSVLVERATRQLARAARAAKAAQIAQEQN